MRHLSFTLALLGAGKLPSVFVARGTGVLLITLVLIVLVVSYFQHRLYRRFAGTLKRAFARLSGWLVQRSRLALKLQGYLQRKRTDVTVPLKPASQKNQLRVMASPPLLPAGNGLAFSAVMAEEWDLPKHRSAAKAAVNNTVPVLIAGLLVYSFSFIAVAPLAAAFIAVVLFRRSRLAKSISTWKASLLPS